MGFWKGLMDVSPASSVTDRPQHLGHPLPGSSQHGPVKGQNSLQRSLVYAGGAAGTMGRAAAADLLADIPTAAQGRQGPILLGCWPPALSR